MNFKKLFIFFILFFFAAPVNSFAQEQENEQQEAQQLVLAVDEADDVLEGGVEITEEKPFLSDFIEVKEGFSRINTKVISEKETAINGNGPHICKEHIDKLFKQIDNIENGDILILSGSIPKNISSSIYEEICKYLQGRDIRIIVDATKDLLVNVLKYHPFLIKPNIDELGEIFNTKVENKEQAIEYGKKLQEMGSQNVMISMGGEGAVLIDENRNIYNCVPPDMESVNTVGAGDSTVAGFIVGYMKNNNYEEALKMGVATGTASACSKYLATKEETIKILKQI